MNPTFPIDFPVLLPESVIQDLQSRNLVLVENARLPDRIQPNDFLRYFINRDQKLLDRKCTILSIEEDRTACQVKYYKGDDTKSWRLNLALGDRIQAFIQGEKSKPADITMPLETQARLLNTYASARLKKKVEISVDELTNFIGSPITYIYIDANLPRVSSVKSVTAKIEDVLMEEGALVLFHSKAEKKYRIFYTNPKYKFFVDKSMTL
jgi:hypothetical protein